MKLSWGRTIKRWFGHLLSRVIDRYKKIVQKQKEVPEERIVSSTLYIRRLVVRRPGTLLASLGPSEKVEKDAEDLEQRWYGDRIYILKVGTLAGESFELELNWQEAKKLQGIMRGLRKKGDQRKGDVYANSEEGKSVSRWAHGAGSKPDQRIPS